MSARVIGLSALAMLGMMFVAAADTPAIAAPNPSRFLTFVDDRRSLAFSLQVEPAAVDAGRFIFEAPGRGLYTGTAGTQMRALTPTSVVVNFDGPAVLRPATTNNGTLLGSVTRPTPVTIHLQAQVDPAHHTAEASLVETTNRYHLVVSAAGKGGVEATAASIESALVRDDPRALFPLLSSDYARYTADSYAQLWSAQEATVGKIVSLQRVATNDPATTDGGLTYAEVVYNAVILLPSGSRSNATFDAYLVREASGWRLWTTHRR